MSYNKTYASKSTAITYLLAGLMLCISVMAQAFDATEQYKTAATLYKANAFDQAAASYEKLLSQGYKTDEVYYNLGNCYYRLGQTSKAIINYERALKLNPQDEDAKHNLAIANLKIIDKVVPAPSLTVVKTWNSMVAARSASGWAYMAAGALWLALICFALYLFSGIRRLAFGAGLVLMLCSLSFLFLGARENKSENQSDFAVLTVPNSFVKSAPDVNGNDLFMLHEGVKFMVLDHVGTWFKIRLADGKEGWIEKGSYETI